MHAGFKHYTVLYKGTQLKLGRLWMNEIFAYKIAENRRDNANLLWLRYCFGCKMILLFQRPGLLISSSKISEVATAVIGYLIKFGAAKFFFKRGKHFVVMKCPLKLRHFFLP